MAGSMLAGGFRRAFTLSRALSTTRPAGSTLSRALSSAVVRGPLPPAVPALPLVGSIPWVSNLSTPEGKTSLSLDPYRGFKELYRRHGPDNVSETHLCADPREFHKVIMADGSYPLGAIELQWPIIAYYKSVGNPLEHFHGRGEPWRRMRFAMQKSILPPMAANAFAPAIAASASAASKAAAQNAHDIGGFTARASFDLFSAVTLGRETRTADESQAVTNAGDQRFCEDTIEALELLSEMHKRFERAAHDALTYGVKISKELLTKVKAGEALSEAERASYLLLNLISLTLLASVDTTSSIINWCLVHLARNPQ
ncbi:cytochrome P450, partial [Pavlovales sp. CCMP2436]